VISTLFKKLNYKAHKRIVVINSPKSFQPELHEMFDQCEIKTNLKDINEQTMLIAFVQKESEVELIAKSLSTLIESDGLIWFAYPKKSSKKYSSEINRDFGWQLLGKIGLEGVRSVAIDDDWSALRFRHVRFIKSFTRNERMILSEEGKVKKAE